ncbi:MAG: putative transposase [Myxococcaceae bacterium]|nr:putative transposase [Myxococcaceae bacterium]
MADPTALPPLSEEFSAAKLGDPRRTRRLMSVLDSAVRTAGGSLPQQSGGKSSVLEGTYRLLGNENIEPEQVLEAHQDRTADRAGLFDEIVVSHDTTSFEFKGESAREGLGLMCGTGQGLYAHYSLAMSRSGEPLGVLGLRVWSRGPKPKVKRHPRDRGLDEDRESLRWHDAIHEVAERLEGKSRAIHVMDREADSYELLADLLEHEQRFVVRVCRDRLLGTGDPGGNTHLYAAMAGTDVLLERELQLSRRSKPNGAKAQRINPARAGRLAALRVRAGSFEIARNRDLPLHLPDVLHLNFVEVVEENSPEGQASVLWRLVTCEPIATAHDVAAVVDLYRMRWTIEEYFKAIKTGCNFEKLQLETGRALVMALAIYSAVAWRLLLVRWMQSERPDADAALVVNPTQLLLLERHMKKIRRPWPEQPTCRDVLLAIAAVGGHIPNNGLPGWQVLGRGFHALLLMEVGWRDAQDALAARSDQ